jgi:hypothetical protein
MKLTLLSHLATLLPDRYWFNFRAKAGEPPRQIDHRRD